MKPDGKPPFPNGITIADLVKRIEYALSTGWCAGCQERRVWMAGALRCRICTDAANREEEAARAAAKKTE